MSELFRGKNFGYLSTLMKDGSPQVTEIWVDFEDGNIIVNPFVDTLESARTKGQLGFADLPFEEGPVKAVTTFARNHDFPNVMILGIGGSALGPLALDAALARPNSGKRLIVLDNIDPDFIRDTLDTVSPDDTIVNVIAKSGVTAETMSTFAIVREWMIQAVGATKARDHFAVTTDPEKGDLLNIARLEKYPIFEIPPNVGGRFSVLTPVGTLPAALLGFDVDALMEGAMRTAIQSQTAIRRESGTGFGIHSVHARS